MSARGLNLRARTVRLACRSRPPDSIQLPAVPTRYHLVAARRTQTRAQLLAKVTFPQPYVLIDLGVLSSRTLEYASHLSRPACVTSAGRSALPCLTSELVFFHRPTSDVLRAACVAPNFQRPLRNRRIRSLHLLRRRVRSATCSFRFWCRVWPCQTYYDACER
jgi:hypothetical protein